MRKIINIKLGGNSQDIYEPCLLNGYESVNSSGAHPPPGQPRGICSNVCPGGGALAILSQPGGWALAYPGATPGHLTHVFLNMGEFVGKDEDFVKDWLVRHGLEKLVDVFKSMFSQF